MNYLSLILSTLMTGVVGLLSFVVAGYIIVMLYQVARELWRRYRERQQSPFQLVADERSDWPRKSKYNG